MSRRRHTHHNSYGNSPSAAFSLVKLALVAVLLGGVGGLTWLALTPLAAPVETVTRTIPNERIAP